jgi:uroporphyrinogen-III synthase
VESGLSPGRTSQLRRGQRPPAYGSPGQRVPAGLAPVLLIGPGDNSADAAAIKDLGLEVWVDPYLIVGPPADPRGAHELLSGLAAPEPGWLLVTSARAFPAWAGIVGADRLMCALRQAAGRGWRAAGVGRATVGSLPELPWPEPLVASSPSGRGLAVDLVALGPSTAVIPQSEIAVQSLVRGLTENGWEVLARPVYTTKTVADRPKSAVAVRDGQVRVIVVRSPSAVVALTDHVVPASGVILVAGGSTTAAAAAARGLPVRVAAGPRPEQVAASVRDALADAGAVT